MRNLFFFSLSFLKPDSRKVRNLEAESVPIFLKLFAKPIATFCWRLVLRAVKPLDIVDDYSVLNIYFFLLLTFYHTNSKLKYRRARL